MPESALRPCRHKRLFVTSPFYPIGYPTISSFDMIHPIASILQLIYTFLPFFG